ncbi:MAG: TonB-dependent receptor [Verrucomicrobiaceae bacterium]|nr:TonB-dependent receptor [Verrucomicrobiaceae bacterium]
MSISTKYFALSRNKLLCLFLFNTLPATADTKPVIDEVIVFGRGENLVGIAPAASEGAVSGADLTVRPLLRVAELLEVVPGLIAAQHSGSGKANQYFLRGFNLDHGTDFTAYIDDVPMNLRTHGHGQGYLDINGLIPETVERIDYRKGPYRADVGDFAMAGASYLRTVQRLDTFISAETGSYGWRRVASGGTFDAGSGKLTVAGQLKSYDGPWQKSEDLKHESVYGKYAQDTAIGDLEISFSGYHATWDPTEQIPERAIGTSVCDDEFCALDPSATGKTLRFITSARLTGDDWRATLYAQRYDWNMLSNPTYDFQINQFDQRWTYGGRYEKNFTLNPVLDLTLGSEGRYDDIGKVGVEHTDAAQFVSPISKHAVKEGSLALYTEATWKPINGLRVLGGLRGDSYSFDVTALEDNLAEGKKADTIFSPKVGLAYALNSNIELYANWGKGFHSNDARGVVNKETPVRGLVRGEGKETGARLQIGNISLTTTYWWLDLDSELKFVGDSNSVEPSNPTQRRGYEIVGFWRPISWLAVDAVWTGSHARSQDSPGAEYVPGAIESAGELGITALHERWEASVRVRHLGPYPLIEDNSQRASAENIVNLHAAWKPGHYTVYGELLNVLDHDGKDIVYYYGSNVAGLDPAGEQVDGRLSRAVEPRTLRVGIKYTF